MTKKITFDGGGFPRFSEDGEYETELDTNIVHRFYLSKSGKLKDKYDGKTDQEIIDLELAQHEELLSSLEEQNAAIEAERQLNT